MHLAGGGVQHTGRAVHDHAPDQFAHILDQDMIAPFLAVADQGDVIADDDGAVIVPRKMASDLAVGTTAHEEWEEFSRLRLAEGGSISKYYPLSEEGQREYKRWRTEQEST